MTKLNNYFFRKLIINFLIIIFSTTLLLLIIRATTFLNLIVGRGMPINYLIYITFLNMPPAWNELLPIGSLIAIIFTWQSMHNSNEMIIMQSCGLKPFQISKPVLLFGILISILCFLFSLFIINFSFVKYLELRKEINNNINLKNIGTNKFIQLTPSIILYVGSKGLQGQLNNVLIDDNNTLEELTIYTKSASIVKDTNSTKLILNNGSIQKLDKSTNATSFINFDFYVLNLDQDENNGSIIRDTPHSLYLWELFHFKVLDFMIALKQHNLEEYNNKASSFIIEINKRLINVMLSITFVVIISFFFSRNKFNRSFKYLPSFKSILVCITLKFLCITFLLTTANLILIFFYYMLIILFTIIVLLKILFYNKLT